MKKRTIRCYKVFANVYPDVYNYSLYYLIHEGWSNFSLATCIHCGERFVIDLENPEIKGISISELAGSKTCPVCHSELRTTIRNYPETIKLPEGKTGTFKTNSLILPDNEGLLMDVFEITT